MKLPGAEFMQICWVVDDLEAAMRRWYETTNAGPFYRIRSPVITNYTYRGTPGTLDMDVGLAQAGPIQIELIQQKNDGPSAYRDAVPFEQQQFHHLGMIPEDYDAQYAHYRELGFAESHSGLAGTARFAYFDTRPALGCMIELIERDDALLSMFKVVADAAIGWDGRDPFREIEVPTGQPAPTIA